MHALRLALLCTLVPACSGGDFGAVVVRWHFIDANLGSEPTISCATPPATGSCCARVSNEDFVVDVVRLLAVPQGTDAGASAHDIACPSCCFSCDPVEHTTGFEIPPGNYLLSILPLRCGSPVGETPPGVVRSVRAGEITNLDAVEILIQPGTPPACGDGGVPGCF